MNDKINHPSHYTSHPSGVECIQVTEHFCFNIGNAIKYLWRAGLKTDDPTEDLKKAAWYVNREIERLSSKKPITVPDLGKKQIAQEPSAEKPYAQEPKTQDHEPRYYR